MKKAFRIIGKIIDTIILIPFVIVLGAILGPIYMFIIVIDSLWDIPSIDD